MESMKKTKLGKKRAFQLLCSYLAIILAPSIAIAVIYANMWAALLDVQREKLANVQGEAVSYFNRELDEAVHVLNRILEAPAVEEYLLKSGEKKRVEEYWRSYRLATDRSYTTFADAFVKGIYVFPKTGDYFVRFPGVFPMDRRGLSTFPALEERVEHETLWETFEKLGEGLVFLRNEQGEDTFLMLRSLQGPDGSAPLGIITVELDTGKIRSLLRQMLGVDEGEAYLADETGEILLSSAGIPSKEELVKLAETSVLLEKTTDYNRWKFVCLVPEKTLAARIGNIRHLISALCICSLLLGVGICIWYWRCNLKVAEQYERFRAAYDAPETAKRKRRTWVKELLEMVDRAEELQRTLQQQEEWAQEGILRKLLEGSYDRIEDVLEEAKRLGVSLPITVPCLAAIFRAEKTPGREAEVFSRLKEELHLRLTGNFRLLEEAPGIYTALFWGGDGETGTRLLLEQLQYRLAGEGFPRIYIGLGGEAKELKDLCQVYEYAGRSAAYASGRKIPVPVSYEELLPKEDQGGLTPEQRVQKAEIERLIRREYGNADFNLAILADQVGMGEKKLYREFKKMYGQSFSDYLETLRLQEAEKRLLSGESVQEVAAAVGYNSDYSFRRAFKRVTGSAPSSRQKQGTAAAKEGTDTEKEKMSGTKKNCPLE